MLVSKVEATRPRFSDTYLANPNPQDALLVEKEKLVIRLTEFIASLPREAREDLEFYSNQIIDRHGRRDEALAEEKRLMELFPNAKELDPRTYEVVEPILIEVSAISGVEYHRPTIEVVPAQEELVETANKVVETPMVETTNRRKVARIKQASEVLLNNVYPKAVEAEPEVIEEDLGISVFSNEAENEISDIVEAPAEVLPVVEEVQIDTIETAEAPFIEPLTQEEKYTHIMRKGQSLADVALALCDDVNGWMDIYSLNKETIENVLIAKNYTDFGNLENDQEIFAGLELVMPTVFKKDPTRLIAA